MADEKLKHVIISRKEAKRLGLKYYFTGKSCKRGHVSTRQVANRTCSICEIRRAKKWFRETKYYQKNREQIRASAKKWRVEHKEQRRAHHRNRKARKRGNGGSHTAKDVAEIRVMQKDRCAMPICRKRLYGRGQIDHIIALVNGGPNDRKNLQILCEACNLSKGAKDPIDHARSLGMLL